MNYANKSDIENAIDQIFALMFNTAIAVTYSAVLFAIVKIASGN